MAAKQEIAPEGLQATNEAMVVRDRSAEEAVPKESEEAEEPLLPKRKQEEDPIKHNYPLGCHALVCIFAEVWDILPLKSLAYGKLTANIIKLQKPKDLNAQLER